MFKSIFIKVFLILFSVVSFANSGSREGISTVIDAAALEPLKDWIHNSKQSLEMGLSTAARKSIQDQESYYRTSIDNVLMLGDLRSNEFLMRNILYRAVDVHNVLLKIAPDPKRNAFARRFLKRSMQWAVEVAGTDEELLKQSNIEAFTKGKDRAALGLQWADMIVQMSFNLPTNDSHLTVLQMAMGYLYNDITRDDANGRHLAPIAGQFLLEYEVLKTKTSLTPLRKLEVIKEFRQFMEYQVVAGLKELNINSAENAQQNSTELSTPSTNSNQIFNIKDGKFGKCSLLKPLTNDRSYNHCGESLFAITFDGYIATDCMSLDKVLSYLKDDENLRNICLSTPVYRSLKILNPLTNDSNYRHCPRRNFAVTYEGAIVNGCHNIYDAFRIFSEYVAKMYGKIK